MNLIDAIKSGQPYRRREWCKTAPCGGGLTWRVAPTNPKEHCGERLDDLLADDWETQGDRMMMGGVGTCVKCLALRQLVACGTPLCEICFGSASKEEVDSSKGKPPLGIMPRRIWREKRLAELAAAIKRRRGTGWAVPREWTDELLDLAEELGE